MDINTIFEELDALPYLEYESYLEQKINEAISFERYDIVIVLLNELIGFYRDTTQFEKGLQAKKELNRVLEETGQSGSMNHATSLLNIANFDRAMGDYISSLEEYRVCESIYENLLDKEDYLWAGLYNNESLLYQMMGDDLAAIGALGKALIIVESIPERRIEVATTYTNIAQSLAALGQMEEAEANVMEALKIFEEDGNSDYHYSAAAAVMGIISYNRGDFIEAARYYDEAARVVKSVMGENENYKLLIANRDSILSMIPHNMSSDSKDSSEIDIKLEVEENNQKEKNSSINTDKEIKGIEICKAFYYEFFEKILEEDFAGFTSKIAVGLFGEGSECFGFDDELSRDHDWGPAFMLLVSRQTYSQIGERLERAYNSLPDSYHGFTRNNSVQGMGRVGVIIIEDYFRYRIGNLVDFTGSIGRLVDRNNLDSVDECILSSLINGEIWRDDEGIVSSIRRELASYYDDAIWIKRLAISLIKSGQTGQYNLPRVLKRGDRVTAQIYLGDYYQNVLRTMFLINRRYAPYEKWLFAAASQLTIHPEVADCLRAIADMDIADDNVLMTIEIIAQLVLSSLKEIGVVAEDYDNWYLEKIGQNLLNGSFESNNTKRVIDKSELVDRIVRLEWDAFDKVQNEGGRASCQDDWRTFEIMRKSQYLEWPRDLLESYIYDFELANSKNWNLITEKYGRMERSTAPERYKLIEPSLPVHTDTQDAIIEQIVSIQVTMMEEMSERFPKMAGNARSIHTSDDTMWNTSYETYLRGELGTYSEETLALYGRFIVSLAQNGENLAYNIMSNTAKMYGYSSVEDCESKI